MAISAAEQLLVELINRARLDPQAEAERLDIGLNQGLAAGSISAVAKQVLAPDAALEEAAQAHTAWMLATQTFSHTGQGGSDAGDRIADAGYDLSGSWNWGENLAYSGTTGTQDLNRAIVGHYENLFASAGHRANTLSDSFREIGVAQEDGRFRGYNASVLTEVFARSGADHFVTGVAIEDRNGNLFYDIGEGQDGVWVAAGGRRAETGSAGGYGLSVAAGPVEVSLGRGAETLARLRLDLSAGNAKLDLIEGGERMVMAVSASAELIEGLSAARLLGAGDLTLTGLRTANRLWGNAGDNQIAGGAGNDRLWGETGEDRLLGGQGRDVLSGGAGRDRLDGGSGDDRLSGGGGADVFVFNGGADVIADFGSDDRLVLDAGALDIAGLRPRDLPGLIEDAGRDLRIDLDGHVLTLSGLGDAGALAGRIDII